MSHPLFGGSGPVSTRGYRPRKLGLAVVWLRVDGVDQDATISALIVAATSWAEGVTRRAFIDRVVVATFSEFPPVGVDLYLPLPPVRSIVSAEFTLEDGTVTPLVEGVDYELEPTYALVRTLPDYSWTQSIRSGSFNYNAGYGGTGDDVPQQIRTAILIALAQMFELRVDQIVGTSVSLPQVKASEALYRKAHFPEYVLIVRRKLCRQASWLHDDVS